MSRRPRGMFGLGLLAALAGAAYGGQAPSATGAVGAAPILVGFRAAHHSGFDRIVFEFRERCPRDGRCAMSIG